MSSKITYKNKVALANDETIADENKVTDKDMNEIKQAINENAEELEDKVDKVEGKGLSTNDYTNEEKSKLEELENYNDEKLKQDISDLQKQVEDLKKNELTESLSGTSLDIQDSADSNVRSIGLRGNSEQDGEPTSDNPVEIKSCGDNIQLFDKNNVKNGYFYSNAEMVNDNWCYSKSELLKAGERYTTSGGRCILSYFNGDTNISYEDVLNKTITVPSDTTKVYISILKSDLDTFKLEKGTKATPYSPYGMGSMTEKIINKNLFDKENISWNRDNNSTFYIIARGSNTIRIKTSSFAIQGGKTYTLSGYPTSVSFISVRAYDKDKALIENGATRTGNTFTLVDEVEYIHLLFGGENFDDTTNESMKNADIQLEEGSTATDYVPHEEQAINIPTQQPMRSIGDVRDDFVRIDGAWYERHNIAQVVLDGSESGLSKINSNNTDATYFQYANPVFENISANVFPNGKSNYLQPNYANALFGNNINGFTYSAVGNLRFSLMNTIASTVEELKTWLSTHNLEVIGVTNESTLLPCTDEQITALEELEKARTYKNVTHIYSEDEVKPVVDLEYVVDTKTYIDNQIKEAIEKGAE